MRTGGWIAIVLVALLSAPALAEPVAGHAFDRHVERLVARPTPAGPVTIGGDEASWRVTVPANTSVLVEALGDDTEPFTLRAAGWNAAEGSVVLPATHAGVFLPEGDWRVRVDPMAGVAVDILVRFRGHVADHDGVAASFTLDEAPPRPLCVTPEACLP